MCRDGSLLHKKIKSLSLHNVQPLSEAPVVPKPKVAKCSKHGKELELVCIQDQCMVCVSCIVTTHHGHKCETVDEFYEKQVDPLQELVKSAKAKLQELEKAAEVVKAEKQLLVDNNEEEGRKITDFFDKVLLIGILILKQLLAQNGIVWPVTKT